MKSRLLLKKIFFYIISFINIFKAIFLVFFFSSFKTATKIKKNKSKLKSCYLLANGPSLNKDLEVILLNKNDYEIMAMNFFCISPIFMKLKPSLYCIADPFVFNTMEGSNKLKKKVDSFISILNKVNWELKLFYPQHFNTKVVLDKIKNNYVIKIPYNSTPLSSSSIVNFKLYSMGLLMPVPESVIIASIFIAINMKFENIYLYGVDHSWISDFKVYKDNTSSFTLNHFHGEDSKTENDRSVSNFMLSQYRLFKSHEVLSDYSDYKGVNIINKTLDSFIDSYKKI